jgi:prolyl-tRNA synthetase
MIFPGPIAPFQVHLIGLNLSDESVAIVAEGLYRELWDQGIETLYDDRVDQAAGVKLNDADLLGLPVRLVVSPRNLRNGMVEIKGRREKEPTLVKRDQTLDLVRHQLVSAGVSVAAPKG